MATMTKLLPNIVPRDRKDKITTMGTSGNWSWDVVFSKNALLPGADVLNIAVSAEEKKRQYGRKIMYFER